MTNAFPFTRYYHLRPEAEYFSLCSGLTASDTVIPSGKGIDGKPQYVNPMDINPTTRDDSLALKSDFILSSASL